MQRDQPIFDLIQKEQSRQLRGIELIASENFTSPAVMEAAGSILTNKYAEGYPGKRYYGGCEVVDEIENLAIERAKELFGAAYVNVQPHSGSQANASVFHACLIPGDKILGFDLSHGGHLTHGSPVNFSGRLYKPSFYGVDRETGLLDYDAIEAIAVKESPKMIIAGASAYPRQIDWETFRFIADQVGALLMVDMAHYSGLIAAGAYDSPLDWADVVTSTTHKTLRGPLGGIILWNDSQHTKKINSAVFPGTQGGPLMNIIAAKAQAFVEASTLDFEKYGAQVVKNAQAMAGVFMDAGFDILTGGTDSHIILLDLRRSKYSGREAADKLERFNITVNKNGVPNDPRPFMETSGIRIGTAAETTRGHDETWFAHLAKRIVRHLSD